MPTISFFDSFSFVIYSPIFSSTEEYSHTVIDEFEVSEITSGALNQNLRVTKQTRIDENKYPRRQQHQQRKTSISKESKQVTHISNALNNTTPNNTKTEPKKESPIRKRFFINFYSNTKRKESKR